MNSLSYSPAVRKVRDEIYETASQSKLVDSWFVPEHLLVVEEKANWLCDLYPEANRDAVGLSVWFHDIARLDGIDEGHDRVGSNKAREKLQKLGFSNKIVDIVSNACLTHRAENIKPVSIEAKILATADAMSHFNHGFYLRIIEHFRKHNDFQTTKAIVLKKLNRDYNEKILFPEAKDKIRPVYEAWMVILNQ